MNKPMLTGVVLALLATGCSSMDGTASSDAYPVAPIQSTFYPPTYTEGFVTSDEQLTLSGRLDGTLRGVSLASDTTQNYGTFSTFDGSETDLGETHLNASIAASGEGGAGMLIVNISGPALRDGLLQGHSWRGVAVAERPAASPGPDVATVSSCAGPTIGEWPYEMGASEYEMDAAEAPDEPGVVVLSVRAQFPRTESDSSTTTELVGTLRFPAPMALD